METTRETELQFEDAPWPGKPKEEPADLGAGAGASLKIICRQVEARKEASCGGAVIIEIATSDCKDAEAEAEWARSASATAVTPYGNDVESRASA